MSVKKLLAYTAAGAAALSASAALAGGPDVLPPAPVFQPYVYIEGNVGYAQSDWRRFPFPNPFFVFGNNARGGFTFGADLGYMIIRNIGIEIGWQYLPRVRGVLFALAPFPGGAIRLNSWLAYLAGRISIPLADSLDLYGKAGVGFRSLRWRGVGAAGIGSTGYWRPYFAIGLLYMFNSNWSIGIQYARFPAYVRLTPLARRAPAVNLYTFNVGYNFEV